MPTFVYSAKNQPNRLIQGNIEANSEQEAVLKLTKMGLFPISVTREELITMQGGTLLLKKIRHKDLVIFTRQLSSLLESGVNILNALNTISNQTQNKFLKVVVRDISERIQNGASLSESLKAYQLIFSPLYSAMIQTGEASGKLNITMKELADFMEEQEEFRNSLRSSLIYPAFVFVVGALTVAVLLIFVIPRLVSMFEDMGQALPIPTRILILTSEFLRSYWWLIIIITVAAIFSFKRFSGTPAGRNSVDSMKLKTYMLGPIILKTEISRLMRTLSLLLSSGIPITPALEVAHTVVENNVLKVEVKRFKDMIANGESLSSSLKSSKLFPEFVLNIASIGEETGQLDRSLMRIADDYEKEVADNLKNLSRMVEPVIILIMGLIVGFIVLSMLLPIFQINLIVR